MYSILSAAILSVICTCLVLSCQFLSATVHILLSRSVHVCCYPVSSRYLSGLILFVPVCLQRYIFSCLASVHVCCYPVIAYLSTPVFSYLVCSFLVCPCLPLSILFLPDPNRSGTVYCLPDQHLSATVCSLSDLQLTITVCCLPHLHLSTVYLTCTCLLST